MQMYRSAPIPWGGEGGGVKVFELCSVPNEIGFVSVAAHCHEAKPVTKLIQPSVLLWQSTTEEYVYILLIIIV